MDLAYILTVENLLLDEKLDRRACTFLDETRKKRINRFRIKEARAESIGAGLLIKLFGYITEKELKKNDMGILSLNVEELLTIIETKQSLGGVCRQPQIDLNGKPFFANKQVYFNISHSSGYVFGVVSDEEIGVDIQQCTDYTDYGIEDRFFHKNESELFKGLSKEQRADMFYSLWVKKESYGKLMGVGISETISIDTEKLNTKVRWKQYVGPSGYMLMTCKLK